MKIMDCLQRIDPQNNRSIALFLPKEGEFLKSVDKADKVLAIEDGVFAFKQSDEDGDVIYELPNFKDKYEIMGFLSEYIGSEQTRKLRLAIEYLVKAAQDGRI